MSADSIAAPAKLNLYLHIGDRRADGYHELETLVAFTELADRLGVQPAEILSLAVSGEFAGDAGALDDNLVLRAARRLQGLSGVKRGAALALGKNIPAGAGFGGGSADAAAALILLDRFWGLNLPRATLMEIAASLGADVPMCLHGTALIARGIGEIIQPLESPLPAMHAVLVWPRKKLATRDVFRHCERSEAIRSVQPAMTGLLRRDAPRNDGLGELLSNTRNDLEAPAIALLPEIGEVLRVLAEAMPRPAFVRMSGSGSACYALFDDAAQAKAVAVELSARHPTWWVRATAIGAAAPPREAIPSTVPV